jgi:hypothetical protein
MLFSGSLGSVNVSGSSLSLKIDPGAKSSRYGTDKP